MQSPSRDMQLVSQWIAQRQTTLPSWRYQQQQQNRCDKPVRELSANRRWNQNPFIMNKKPSHYVLDERCITFVFKYSACNFEQHKVIMNRPIYFRGGNSFLSNFYVCRIHAWGHTFNTVEAAYIYRKTVFYDDMETADKMLAWTTGEIP